MTLYDRDIREPLFEWVEAHYPKVRIIEEKPISSSRADAFMVLLDRLVGVEIKSDADSYSRLPGQVRDYDRYFDENILAVGSTRRHAASHIPEWWGIVTVTAIEDDSPQFQMIREPKAGPLTEPRLKLGMLWRPELAHILEKNNTPRYQRKSKRFVIDRIATLVKREELDPQISDEVFERDYTTIRSEIEAYRRRSRRH